jgi:hypothetical protein
MGECVIDGQLKCVAKREFVKRGARFAQISLQRSTGRYTVKYTVPATQAAGIEIGGWYKVAILPDSAPDVKSPKEAAKL